MQGKDRTSPFKNRNDLETPSGFSSFCPKLTTRASRIVAGRAKVWA